MRFPLLLSLIVPTFLVGCAGTQPPELLPGTITSARGVEMKVEGDGKAQKEEKKLLRVLYKACFWNSEALVVRLT